MNNEHVVRHSQQGDTMAPTEGRDQVAAVRDHRGHPFDCRPRTIFWFPISEFHPTLVTLPYGSKLLHTTTVDNQIRVYVEMYDLRDAKIEDKVFWANHVDDFYELVDFRCVRAGMTIPRNFRFLDYATLRDGRCRNHVYWTRRPIDA